MTQLLLPIFPSDTILITETLGVCTRKELVTYFHSGMPIYSHGVHELNKFRYTTSNFIVQGLCRSVDIQQTFHVSSDSVRRWKKAFEKYGEEVFFNEDKRKGRSHKLLPDMLERNTAK